MPQENTAYKQILKATSIFGGVQLINIFLSIVRSKFIAILLGPIGIGISGMLTATVGIISGLTNFGIGTSAVREISTANENGNPVRISIVVSVVNFWAWVTGIIGLLLTLIFAPFLSYLSFGNYNYTIPFIFLSITLLTSQLTSSNLVFLQGSGKLGFLAKTNVVGNFLGLLTAIPIFYLWGIDGIVASLIVSSGSAYFVSYYFKKKVSVQKVQITKARAFLEGRQMLKMGLVISLTGFITLGSSYVTRLFITHFGGVQQLGLYNAGFAITTSYVGLIFNAMATDYYPRLSRVSSDTMKSNEIINEQAEIALIILGPIILIFILFINWIVRVLYSNQFLEINEMIVWTAFGMLFKALSWSIAFIFLAKAKSRIFFRNELLTNAYLILLNLLGFYYFGLLGLGIAFASVYLIYTIQVYLVAKTKFGFTLRKQVLVIFLVQIIFAILSIYIYYNLVGVNFIVACSGLILISVGYSIYLLNQRIRVISYLMSLKRK
jgi:O-antigen/teichoic acid export membrane protein